EQRQELQDHAGGQPEGAHLAEQVQVLARPDQFGHDQVLDDQQQREDDDAAAQRLEQEREPAAPAPPPAKSLSPSLVLPLALPFVLSLALPFVLSLVLPFVSVGGVVTGIPAGFRRVSPHKTPTTLLAG